MEDDIAIRRRRASYRAHHRGTRELDLLMGRFADHALPVMGEQELTEFERLLSIADPQLQAWLMDPRPPTVTEFSKLIYEIRRFHLLDGDADEIERAHQDN